MKLKKYIPEGQHYQTIADIKQAGFAKAFLGGIEARRDQIRDQNETRPMVCDADITKDFRFKAGAVWALNWVLSIPDEARKIVAPLPDN